MSNEELFEGIEERESITERLFGLSLLKFFLLILLVLGLGVYIGVILYGANSFEVFLGLQDYEEYLQNEINRLKDENAELQKEYFELKEISAK